MALSSQLKIDKYLTNYSQEQPQGDFVYDKINAVVPVQTISGKIRTRGEDKFDIQETLRVGDAASNKATVSEGSSVTYYCEEHALHSIVLEREMANVEQIIELEKERTMDLTSKINLDLENNVLSALSGLTNTSAIVNEWDDYTDGDPIVDIDTAIKTMWDNGKVVPTHMILGFEVALRLSNHPDIREYVKYVQPNQLTPMVNLPMNFRGMNLIVAGASYNNANLGESQILAEIIGENVYFIHQESATKNSFSCIKTFQYKDLTVKKADHFDPAGKKILVARDYDTKIIDQSAGYKLTNALS